MIKEAEKKRFHLESNEMPNKWRIREFKDSRRGEICTGKTEAYWISSGSIQMSDHHWEKPENTFLAKKGISFLRKGIWSYPITVQHVLLKREWWEGKTGCLHQHSMERRLTLSHYHWYIQPSSITWIPKSIWEKYWLKLPVLKHLILKGSESSFRGTLPKNKAMHTW